jgi:hypothetical protein
MGTVTGTPLVERLCLLACNKTCYRILNCFGLEPFEWPRSPFCRFDFPLQFCRFEFRPFETAGLSTDTGGYHLGRIKPFGAHF